MIDQTGVPLVLLKKYAAVSTADFPMRNCPR